MSDLALYFINMMLVTVFSVSAAGSVFFILSKILADLLCKRYEVSVLYALMRAEVLFFVVPAFVLAAGASYSRTHPEWGVLEPGGIWTVIGYESDSGIVMIWNPELTLARCMVFAVWLAGFLFVFLRRLMREKMELGKIRAASAEWEDRKVHEICSALKEGLGIRRKIKIYKCSVITSPFSAGFWHSSIFFPSGLLCGEEFVCMLKHELVHCKRKDVAYSFFMMLARGMHWYNPVIYTFERVFFNYSELACDEKVLGNAGPEECYGYAKLLLTMMEEEKEKSTMKYITGFAGRNEKEAERRMVHIMKGKKKAAKPAAVAAAVFFAVFCPAVTYAASQAVYLADSSIAMKALDAVSAGKEMELDFTEYAGYYDLTKEDLLDFDRLRLTERGLINIDTAVSGSGEKNLFSVSLNKGDYVRVSIFSENPKDSFIIGLKNKSGLQQYSYSKEGYVAHTFFIDEKSDYMLFVRGVKAADASKIKIIGNASIG